MHIKDHLPTLFPVKKGPTSERASLISRFVEEINKERIGTKWQPVTGKGIAMKLSHIKDLPTLYYFFSQCKQAKKGFGWCFFGSLKIRDK